MFVCRILCLETGDKLQGLLRIGAFQCEPDVDVVTQHRFQVREIGAVGVIGQHSGDDAFGLGLFGGRGEVVGGLVEVVEVVVDGRQVFVCRCVVVGRQTVLRFDFSRGPGQKLG